MSGLNLTPNEFIGYRIKADYLNWTVVKVKRHGEGSKFAGEEYVASVLGYCRSLSSAVRLIIERDAKEAAQYMPMLEAFERAEKSALDAVSHLERTLDSLGLVHSDVAKKMKLPEPTEDFSE